MKDHKQSDGRVGDIQKRLLEFDLAYCDATYDSQEGRDRCYTEAKETRGRGAETGR
ncbi:hypothetical protein [Desulfospira joergensenii]|uniref:hypothetical protein n=1 Tax=Desulfospira joergensenii TaxID=53329 RepID=UPI0003B3378A|nr:hypothetical protein [Desulfospira joergensenii]